MELDNNIRIIKRPAKSQAQLESFKKATEARKKNIELRKQLKAMEEPKVKLQTEEDSMIKAMNLLLKMKQEEELNKKIVETTRQTLKKKTQAPTPAPIPTYDEYEYEEDSVDDTTQDDNIQQFPSPQQPKQNYRTTVYFDESSERQQQQQYQQYHRPLKQQPVSRIGKPQPQQKQEDEINIFK